MMTADRPVPELAVSDVVIEAETAPEPRVMPVVAPSTDLVPISSPTAPSIMSATTTPTLTPTAPIAPARSGLPPSVIGLIATIGVLIIAAINAPALAAAGVIPQGYVEMLPRLCVDLIAVSIFSLVIFQRRHNRPDLVVAFICFNVGLFAVMSTISTRTLDPGLGFGLFGLLSIIRLRSEPFSNVELGYFFIVLVLALLTGISGTPLLPAVGLTILVVLIAALIDGQSQTTTVRSRTVTLDTVQSDPNAVRSLVEQLHGVRVVDVDIMQIDMVRDLTQVRVKYIDGRG
jgi:hypothetical protein